MFKGTKETTNTFNQKLYLSKWTIGICQGTAVEDIVRSRSFDPEIRWMKTATREFIADPFPLAAGPDQVTILCETLSFKENYGTISLLQANRNMEELGRKTLVDTKSHLSYPFVFTENGQHYVFPESRQSGKLSCYRYDPLTTTMTFLTDILREPLLDATIVRNENTYWLFGCISSGSGRQYELHLYSSGSLLGPYEPHAGNPVKRGADGVRPAGNFISVDGILYRPAQNCKRQYGESVTIHRVNRLSADSFGEEPWVDVRINPGRRCNRGMRTLHTINAAGNDCIIDGEYAVFAPWYRFKTFISKKGIR